MGVDTMKAVYCDGGTVSIRTDYALPSPLAGECRVRVVKAGVCATDLKMMAGYRPDFAGVLGHEFVGVVEAAPNFDAWIGQRVVGEINMGCGKCGLCRRGLAKHCRSRRTLGISGKDGVFAEYLTVPSANLHRVPDSVSDEQAVFTEPLAAALQILEQVRVRPTDAVAVVGDGRLGLLIAQVVGQTGCQLTVFGRHRNNLQLLDHVGAELVPALSDDDSEDSGGDLFDVVVEATGSESGFASARKKVRPGGVIVLKSTYAHPLPAFDCSSLVVDEVSVIGSRCGPFAPALRMLARGQVRVDEMIHARFPLEDALGALDYAGRSGVLKVLIDP